jgi:hypothetical protein
MPVRIPEAFDRHDASFSRLRPSLTFGWYSWSADSWLQAGGRSPCGLRYRQRMTTSILNPARNRGTPTAIGARVIVFGGVYWTVDVCACRIPPTARL